MCVLFIFFAPKITPMRRNTVDCCFTVDKLINSAEYARGCWKDAVATILLYRVMVVMFTGGMI